MPLQTEEIEIIDAQMLPRREYLRRQAQLNGQEHPDPTPVEVSCEPPPLSLREEMRRFIKTELSLQAEQHGAESFEESNDFEIDAFEEDPDLTSQYTVHELGGPEMPADELEGSPTAEDRGDPPPVDPSRKDGPQEPSQPPPAAEPQSTGQDDH